MYVCCFVILYDCVLPVSFLCYLIFCWILYFNAVLVRLLTLLYVFHAEHIALGNTIPRPVILLFPIAESVSHMVLKLKLYLKTAVLSGTFDLIKSKYIWCNVIWVAFSCGVYIMSKIIYISMKYGISICFFLKKNWE